MEWRNNITSPQGFRYFLVVFDSTAELADYDLPEWFDEDAMGIIGIYYLEGFPTIVMVDGPDTTEGSAWYSNLGYPVYTVGPVTEHNLKVRYQYGSITYMAFCRNPLADSFKLGKRMYAWTVADNNFDTLWTDTLDCETTTKLWKYDEGVWSQSADATIAAPVWVDLVSVLVEVEGNALGSESVHIHTTQDDYYNAITAFVGGLAEEGESVTIEVTGAGWKWADTETSETPRTIAAPELGLFLTIVDA